MNQIFRSKLLWLHTWSGLIIGLAIVFLAVTGGGMVLRPVLDDLVNADLMVVGECSARLPIDDLVKSAKLFHPSGKIKFIEISNDATSSAVIGYENKDQVFVNPCSGAVLGQQNMYSGYFGTLDWLHRFKFIEEGRSIAGWFNLIFLVLLLIGGIALWWPRKGQSLSGLLKFNPRLPGSARTLNLHRVVGIYSAIGLIIIAITAIPIGFEPVKEFIYKQTNYKPPIKPKSDEAGGRTNVPMQAVYQKVMELVPDHYKLEIRFPKKPEDSVEVEVRENHMPHAHAKSYVYIDAYSGEPLKVNHYVTDTPIGRKIYLYCIAIHAGLIAGLPYQIFLLLVSFAIPVQAYSGFSPYLRRQFRRLKQEGLALTVVSKKKLTADIVEIELKAENGSQLPSYAPGAHLELLLSEGKIRQYSMTTPSGDRQKYVIAVLLHANSRGGSKEVHQSIHLGQTVLVRPPKNFFPLVQNTSEVILIAGGIGITPLMSMAREMVNSGRKFTLHYFAKSREHAAFAKAIEDSKLTKFSNFYFELNRNPDRALFSEIIGDAQVNKHLYVCGPAEMIALVQSTALGKGWNAAHVHKEHFSAEVSHREDDTAFDVQLFRSGKVIRVNKGETVAAALEKNGIYVPTSCAQGVCGTCLTKVLEGSPDHRDSFLTSEEQATNSVFTPCCSRANSSKLVLDI